jgi:hypothetical protein
MIKYRIDSGTFQNYTEPFYLSDDGEDIYLEWCAVDNDGNYSDVDGPFICSIDQTEPEISLTYEIVGGNPEQGWDFELTATCFDDTSGMERVEFYFNNLLMETVYGSGPDFVWTIRYWPVPRAIFSATAYDNAGNSNSDAIMDSSMNIVLEYPKVFVDTNKECNTNQYLEDISSSKVIDKGNKDNNEVSISQYVGEEVFDPAYVIVVFNRKLGKNGWLVSNVSIPIFYETDRIDEVYYKLNDGDWIKYASPKIILDDGFYNFSWYAVDYDGYTSTPKSVYMKIDSTKPDVNLIRRRLGVNSIRYIAEVDEETSGIDRVKFCEYFHGPAYYVDYVYPYEWFYNGIIPKTSVTAVVFDKAGNKAIDENHIFPYQQEVNQRSMISSYFRLFERFPALEVLLRIMNLLR